MTRKFVVLLNNLAKFSINLFIFEISMDMLTLRMNVCMYEFMYVKCSDILISKLFSKRIIFIDSSFYLYQILNKSDKLGHNDPKPDQKKITWAFELIVGLNTSLFLLN